MTADEYRAALDALGRAARFLHINESGSKPRTALASWNGEIQVGYNEGLSPACDDGEPLRDDRWSEGPAGGPAPDSEPEAAAEIAELAAASDDAAGTDIAA